MDKLVKDRIKDNSEYLKYKDINKLHFKFPEYVKQYAELHVKEIPADNLGFKVSLIKEMAYDIIKAGGNLDKNITIENLQFSTEDGIVMEDDKKLKYYDKSKEGEQTTMEINVDFKDIIALRICN